MPGDTKPSPESILTYQQWGPVTFTWWQFKAPKNTQRYLSLNYVWNYTFKFSHTPGDQCDRGLNIYMNLLLSYSHYLTTDSTKQEDSLGARVLSQYKDGLSRYGDFQISRYDDHDLYNRNSYTDTTTSLYWDGPQISMMQQYYGTSLVLCHNE